MTQRSMFFDSTSGDRIYTSDSWAQIFGRIFSDGVVAGYASGMAVAASGPAAMTVSVPLGSLWVQGRFLDVYTSNETLTVLTSDPTNPRIDRVVARIDYTGRTLALAVLKGTAAATPAAPALTQNTTTWEMSLAQIRVNAGATSIVAGNITDERTFITNAAAIAFGKIVVGASTITSTVAGDTLNLVAGANITLTPNTGTKTVTVAVAEGSGSSLNADTLDGIDSTGFSLSTHLHDSRYLQLTGGTLSGQFGIGTTGEALMILNSTTGLNSEIDFYNSTVLCGSIIGHAAGELDIAAPVVNVSTGALDVKHAGNVLAHIESTDGNAATIELARSGSTVASLSVTSAATLDITATNLHLNGTAVPTLAGGGSKVSVASTAPASPATGDVWIDTSIVL